MHHTHSYMNQGKVWDFWLLLFLGNGKSWRMICAGLQQQASSYAYDVVLNWQQVEWFSIFIHLLPNQCQMIWLCNAFYLWITWLFRRVKSVICGEQNNTSFKHNLSPEEVASLRVLGMLIWGNSDHTIAEVWCWVGGHNCKFCIVTFAFYILIKDETTNWGAGALYVLAGPKLRKLL
jgi:hypothetical protein